MFFFLLPVLFCPTHLDKQFPLSGRGFVLLLQSSGVLHRLVQVSVLQLSQLPADRLPVLSQPLNKELSHCFFLGHRV